MTFAAPWFAWIAGVAALAVVGLHLLAWRRPPETPLPTARFAPERPIRMVSRAIRPADFLLLAIRVAMVLLAGLALAGPRFERRRAGSARVVVVDRSHDASSSTNVVAAAVRELRPGDALVVFDSAAREIAPAVSDSISTAASMAPGALSPALVVAIRAARRLERERDSVAIVVVSPFARGELDAATTSIRALWSGQVRRVRVDVSADSTGAPGRPELRADPADAVAVAIALNGAVPGGDRVRVIRDSVTAADSASARSGQTIVVWPKSWHSGWLRRDRADTAMAVTAIGAGAGTNGGQATVVAAFGREWRPPPGRRVVARWNDGDAAATEAPLGDGCIREVVVDVPAAGDLALTPAFRRFARRMAQPCGSSSSLAAVDSVLDRVIPVANSRAQSASVGSANTIAPSRLTVWLLALALAAAVSELFVRRRGDHASA